MKEGYVVPLREKFAYGIGDTAINLGYGAVGFYMLWFMVNVGGITPSLAGLIFMLARGWDAISDYLMGRISDQTKSKWGRRKPYIFFGAIPMGITFAFLWFTPSGSEAVRFFYYLFIFILFNTAFTVVAVPYGALTPEMSQNYDERAVLSGFRMGSSFIGTLIGAAGVSLLVDVVYADMPKSKSFFVMGAIFGVVIIGILFITAISAKERVEHREQIYEGFRATLGSFFRLKEFRIMMGMFLFNMIGLDIIMATIAFYLGDVMHISGDMQFVFMGIPLLVAVGASPLWVSLAKRWGKRKAYIVSAVYFVIALLFALIVPAGNLISLGIVCAFIGVGISASQVIPWSMLPDLIEIDEYENGVRREGAFYGISTFLYKCASAVAIALSGAVLELFGYIEASVDDVAAQVIVQPDSALIAVRIMLAVVPCFFLIGSAVFAKILPITRERYEKILKELNGRKKSVSVEI